MYGVGFAAAGIKYFFNSPVRKVSRPGLAQYFRPNGLVRKDL